LHGAYCKIDMLDLWVSLFKAALAKHRAKWSAVKYGTALLLQVFAEEAVYPSVCVFQRASMFMVIAQATLCMINSANFRNSEAGNLRRFGQE
jgi:hypothetical protein